MFIILQRPWWGRGDGWGEGVWRQSGLAALCFPHPAGSPVGRGEQREPRWTEMHTHKHSHTHALIRTRTQSLTCHMLSHLHHHQAAYNPRALWGIYTHTSTPTLARSHTKVTDMYVDTQQRCSQCVTGGEDSCSLSCSLELAPTRYSIAAHTIFNKSPWHKAITKYKLSYAESKSMKHFIFSVTSKH